MFDIIRLPQEIEIGYEGEKNAREIQIKMDGWLAEMPDGVPSIVLIRPGETAEDAYIAATTFENGIMSWTVTAADAAIEGRGVIQIWMEETEDDSVTKRRKSAVAITNIRRSLNDPDDVPPAAQEAWLEQMTGLKTATVTAAEDAAEAKDDAVAAKEAAEDAQDAAEDAQEAAETAQGKAEDAQEAAEDAQEAAEDAAEHYPYVDGVTGNWMVWDVTLGLFVDTGIHAKGDTGTVPAIAVGTVTTLLPGSQATVERRSGSPDTAPIFDFGIPKGDTGTAENIYGNTIDMTELDSTKVATAIGNKADLVAGAVTGNLAALDADGNLTDSGSAAADFIEKVSGATSGNLAGLNSSGEVTDSGKAPGDFLTKAAQVLTDAEKDQVCTNLGISRSTMRKVPISVAVGDWTGSGTSWTATFTTAYITTTSLEIVLFDGSIKTYGAKDITASKKTGGGGMVLATTAKPTGTISGNIYVMDNDDGKVPVLIEDTVVGIANGGTGESSLAGAKQALGVTAAENDIATLNGKITSLSTWTQYNTSGDGKDYPTNKPFVFVVSKSGGGYDSKYFPNNPSDVNVYFNVAGSPFYVYFNGNGRFVTTNIPSGYSFLVYTH